MKLTQSTAVLAFFSIFTLYSSVLGAGTVVTIQNKNEVMTVLSDGKQARMNMGSDDYIIVNYANSSVKVVDKKQRQVMLIAIDDMPKAGRGPRINTAIKNLGSGPSIAGYKTQKFSYTVNGKTCGVIYGSYDAYQVKGIEGLFNALKLIADSQQAMMGGFAGMIDACTLGDMKLPYQAKTIGVPMRKEDNGVVTSEIKSIKLDVTLAADTFVVPSSYTTVDINEEVVNVTKDLSQMEKRVQQQMQQYPPEIQQMMKQMQQSGQLPPEVMESILRAQEQFKQ